VAEAGPGAELENHLVSASRVDPVIIQYVNREYTVLGVVALHVHAVVQ
jgi:hypothetical protein